MPAPIPRAATRSDGLLVSPHPKRIHTPTPGPMANGGTRAGFCWRCESAERAVPCPVYRPIDPPASGTDRYHRSVFDPNTVAEIDRPQSRFPPSSVVAFSLPWSAPRRYQARSRNRKGTKSCL